MSAIASNIRVSASWLRDTVFAGETIECHITFKNIAELAHAEGSLDGSQVRSVSIGEGHKRASIVQAQGQRLLPNTHQTSGNRGSRTASSSGRGSAMAPVPTRSESWNGASSRAKAAPSQHRRSVSILSMGAVEPESDTNLANGGWFGQSHQTRKSHTRSASLQIFSRSQGAMNAIPGGKCP